MRLACDVRRPFGADVQFSFVDAKVAVAFVVSFKRSTVSLALINTTGVIETMFLLAKLMDGRRVVEEERVEKY